MGNDDLSKVSKSGGLSVSGGAGGVGKAGGVRMIDCFEGLVEWAEVAGRAGGVAMDTEFLRERTYFPKLCLVQAATLGGGEGGAEDGDMVCIDALAVEDLSPLGAVLGAAGVEKVFHSCQQDLEALETRLAVRVNNVFDTQIAAAFCGYEQVGYGALVKELCGVHLEKAHARADWSRRPLRAEFLEYAMDDVRYLPMLRRRLEGLLEERGRVGWHREECDLAVVPVDVEEVWRQVWRRLKGMGRLDAVGQECAMELVRWREGNARKRDLPRSWVLNDGTLLRICHVQPRGVEGLGQIGGVGQHLLRRYGAQIVEAIGRCREMAGEEQRVRGLTGAEKGRVQEILERLNGCAKEAGISRVLLASRLEVERFVRGEEGAEEAVVGGWRGELVGGLV